MEKFKFFKLSNCNSRTFLIANLTNKTKCNSKKNVQQKPQISQEKQNRRKLTKTQERLISKINGN